MSYRPITDIWILARPKVKYYGAYPNGFLERARALLGVTPDDAVLHVCGGRARQYPARRGFGPNDKTLDLDTALEPDFEQSANDPLPLSDCGRKGCLGCAPWKALIADPPYTAADAAHYAPKELPNERMMLRNMLDVVRVGGRVGFLHYLIPQPPAHDVKRNPVLYRVRFVACIGVFVGFNNRMRAFSVFEKEAL